MQTFHLFINKEFCIRNVFETLQEDILEPGIVYTEIKEQDLFYHNPNRDAGKFGLSFFCRIALLE